MTHLDPDILSRMSTLELQARRVVDGYLAGMHRSPRHGFSVEFAQHRDYVLGDDIRHVDWKVYGRTERFFLKQYELETNLVLWLLVDGSDSMRYASGSVMKYDYAATAAASLAYLAHRQSDSFGLATFDAKIQAQLRPSSQSSHLNDMLRILSNGPSSEKSRIGGVLHEAADRFVRRGIVVVFSDLFDEPAEILSGMRHLRHCRHEVVVFHVLDPAEIEFPFREATLFRGLEQLPDLLTDPLGVRESYLSEFGKYLEEIEQGCRTQNIEYVRMNTERDLGEALAEYLGRRAGS